VNTPRIFGHVYSPGAVTQITVAYRAPGKNGHFLDEPAGHCYCFSELTGRLALALLAGARRSEKQFKPLKTMN
jgi:hypothetical protein